MYIYSLATSTEFSRYLSIMVAVVQHLNFVYGYTKALGGIILSVSGEGLDLLVTT